MKKLALAFLLVVSVLSAFADTQVVDGITWTYVIANGEASVGGGSPSSRAVPTSTTGSIAIPSTLGNCPVTSIGNYAFYNCSRLTSITIPNSVKNIGRYALYYCSRLTSITIPNSVTSIGDNAFRNCSVLVQFSVDEWNPTYRSVNGLLLTKDGETLIAGVNGDVLIPNIVTSIGSSAFYGCSGLTAITIPNSVTNIGSYAFSNCSRLMSITIPDSVTTIGNSAFYGCSGLTSITIPNSVTSVGNDAFSSCSGLTSITIPNSVTNIGNSAFSHCSGLASITIPNSVTSIGNSAFSYCSGLASITIPNSVTSIGNSAFRNCSGLVRFSVDEWNPTYCSVNGLLLTKDGETLVAGVNGDVLIPNIVVNIGNDAFYGCSELTSITIPKSVTTIGNWAFSNCSRLMSITIPNSMTNIGGYAFYGCSGLNGLVVPESLEQQSSTWEVPSGCTVIFRNLTDVYLAVSSTCGTPDPVGLAIPCTSNEVRTCSVEPVVPDGSPDIRHLCTGWTGTGSVPSSGTATNVTFAITEDSTLTWNWRKENRIAVSVTGCGECAFGTQWVEDGTVVVAEIVPTRHFHDAITLSGDTIGVTLAGTELSIPSDRPRVILVDVADLTGLIETGKAVSWAEAGADAGWRIASDETAEDGHSLRSEETGAAKTAAIEATVEGAGAFSFDWRISSARGHYARFYLDGVETNAITRSTQWATVAHTLGDGRHVLRWTYEKGTGATAGEDAAFLDNVRWTPLTLEEALDPTNLAWTTDGSAGWIPQISVSFDGTDAAKSGAVFGEATSRLSTVVTNAGTLAWKWKADVVNVAGVDVWLDGEDLYDSDIFLEGSADWADASLEIEGDGEHIVMFEFWNGGTEATISDCAYIDCVSWTPAKPTSIVVDGVEIPSAWIATNALAALAETGGDYEAAAKALAANGVNKVWECYVAGLSPTNAAARFEARVKFENGEPVVTWDPDLGAARDYVVEGKTNLLDRSWGPTNESTRFFRVKVSMP